MYVQPDRRWTSTRLIPPHQSDFIKQIDMTSIAAELIAIGPAHESFVTKYGKLLSSIVTAMTKKLAVKAHTTMPLFWPLKSNVNAAHRLSRGFCRQTRRPRRITSADLSIDNSVPFWHSQCGTMNEQASCQRFVMALCTVPCCCVVAVVVAENIVQLIVFH